MEGVVLLTGLVPLARLGHDLWFRWHHFSHQLCRNTSNLHLVALQWKMTHKERDQGPMERKHISSDHRALFNQRIGLEMVVVMEGCNQVQWWETLERLLYHLDSAEDGDGLEWHWRGGSNLWQNVLAALDVIGILELERAVAISQPSMKDVYVDSNHEFSDTIILAFPMWIHPYLIHFANLFL